MRRYLTLNRAHQLFNEAFNQTHPFQHTYPPLYVRPHKPRRYRYYYEQPAENTQKQQQQQNQNQNQQPKETNNNKCQTVKNHHKNCQNRHVSPFQDPFFQNHGRFMERFDKDFFRDFDKDFGLFGKNNQFENMVKEMNKDMKVMEDIFNYYRNPQEYQKSKKNTDPTKKSEYYNVYDNQKSQDLKQQKEDLLKQQEYYKQQQNHFQQQYEQAEKQLKEKEQQELKFQEELKLKQQQQEKEAKEKQEQQLKMEQEQKKEQERVKEQEKEKEVEEKQQKAQHIFQRNENVSEVMLNGKRVIVKNIKEIDEKGKAKFEVMEKIMDGEEVVSEKHFKGDEALQYIQNQNKNNQNQALN